MKCFTCSKISITEINCPFCLNYFCSYKCLETHINTNHISKSKPPIKSIYEKPKINRILNKNSNSTFSSPYITYGFIAKNITYEKKYNLNNFVPEIKNNEQIVVGTGSYGKVYLYRNIIDRKLYVIKHMEKFQLTKALKSLSGIYDEINIQSRIFHQNIVRLLYVKENSETFDLIMEYANGGSLFYYIRDKTYLTEMESFQFFSQIINAVYFLHKNDIIHRDIKPENILLYDNNLCKLCDFGWCAKLDGKQRRTFCGTTEYMSPEIVNKIEYSKEIDIWSLGILLYEMVHGYSPFRPDKDEFNPNEVIDNIKIHDLRFNISISSECRDLIRHMLDENVEKRYKIEDIFNSKFVKKYENKNLFYPKENINSHIKIQNEVKSVSKVNNNLFDKNYKNGINSNCLKIDLGQNTKLKTYNSQKLLPNFLKNASRINLTNGGIIKDIGLKKNNFNLDSNENNNLFFINKIKENSNENSYSSDFENTKKKEKPTDSNNNLNNLDLYNSISYRFIDKSKKIKLNLSEQNILNDKESKYTNSNTINFNIKNQNSESENLDNIINFDYLNKIKTMNISSLNEHNDNNSENEIKKLNIISRFGNKNIYDNLKNYRKLRLNNYYSADKDEDNDKDAKMSDPDNMPFASVKKLSNDTNPKDKRIINYNNYLTTYRNNHSIRRQYEKITVFNTQKSSTSDRESSGPKDNTKTKEKDKISFNIPHNNNFNTTNNTNTNNSPKEHFTKRKVSNSLRLANYSSNINMLKHYKMPSLENNYRLNSQILKSENVKNNAKNRIYFNKNIPVYDKTQINNKNTSLNHTYRPVSNNNRLFKNNYNTFLNNYDKLQINTNYIFNPKISITLPTNSTLQKSKKTSTSPKKNYKIIYLGNSLDSTNLKNLQNLTKSQSFLKTNFLNINNKRIKENNNIKLLKNKEKEENKEKEKELNMNNNNFITNRKRKYGTLNKNEKNYTPRFNTQREKDKKSNTNRNLNMDSLFKGKESPFLKNKKYIKMNEITKYKNINLDNNHKSNSKTKKNITNTDKNENLKLIHPLKLNKEKENNSPRKRNYKIKLNNNNTNNNSNNKINTNNDNKIKKKSKEKKLFMNSYSERNGLMLNDKDDDKIKLFTSRNLSKSKSKKNEDMQKTPKKEEDKIKIIPSSLLNNFSKEFHSFKNKGIK